MVHPQGVTNVNKTEGQQTVETRALDAPELTDLHPSRAGVLTS